MRAVSFSFRAGAQSRSTQVGKCVCVCVCWQVPSICIQVRAGRYGPCEEQAYDSYEEKPKSKQKRP